ncbi:hypothetical protein [Streptomyces sp. XH2]|uniref:hypothetical protein n=1 Tax=Streptomyces sp. XH2 TaxID=3412483 RepID=UPI003C7A21FF
MSNVPYPQRAAQIDDTDPRVRALALTRKELDGDRRPAAERHREAHAWLRAAVAAGLLPMISPATGKALHQVELNIDRLTGYPDEASYE